MEFEEFKKKRLPLPIVSKCACCMCIPFEIAVRIYAIILIAWHIIIGFLLSRYDEKDYFTIFSVVVNIILALSLCLFIIGSIKKIRVLMKQCQYIYALYVIYSIFALVASLILILKKDTEDIIQKWINNLSKEDNMSQETMETYVKLIQYTIATISLLKIGFFVYFFIILYSYIHKFENVLEQKRQQKYLESLEINIF